ncbi:MAG: J domain-containing protein [Planctomycetes bacterium]|nr:J domain-containing protein [Planctomycetota bacterium]
MSDYFKRLENILRAKLNAKLGAFDKDDDDLDPDEILRQGGFDPKDFTSPADRAPAAQDEVTKAYANLELSPPVTLAEAKTAWRKLMAKFHPDRHQGDPRKEEIATKVAAKLTEAYRIVRKDLGDLDA